MTTIRRVLPACLALAAAAQASSSPGPHNVVLAADWETRLLRFATVDQPDRRIVRHLHVNPAALAAARPGQPLPHGTILVMADTRARLGDDGTPLQDRDGRFIPEPGWIAISVQQKQAGWGAAYAREKRNGEWEYARFNPDGSPSRASVEACFACHLHVRAQQDFAFDFWDYVQARR